MTTLKIKPVITQSVGGIKVTLDGINLGTPDLIAGKLTTAKMTLRASWDQSGKCRDNDSSCDLNLSSDEVTELITDAKNLIDRGLP